MIATTPDERAGAPSASSMDRLYACAGSHQASAGIEDVESDAARSGSRIHALIAGEDVDTPTSGELEMAATCLEMAERLVKDEFGNTIEQCDKVTREERLWSTGRTYSGKADLVVSVWDETIVVDYKTGRGEVESPNNNKQLRTLAVLASKHSLEPMKRIGVAIVQPLATSTPEVVWYTAGDIELARAELDWVVSQSAIPDAKRVAGEVQCKYCPAKSRCPEANSVVAALTLIPEAIMALSSEQLSQRLDACKLAESVIEAVRDEAKRRLESGEAVAGWEMKAGNTRESITDAQEVYTRFDAAGGTIDQFMSAVTVAKAKLQDAYKLATGAKGKELSNRMESLLSGCVETKQNAPSLVKSK